MNYVYSTLTADHGFNGVVIFGRCGAKRNRMIETPKGVATPVTDAQLEMLQRHKLFNAFCRKGHIVVQAKELAQSKVEKLIDGHMQASDGSAQETRESLKKKSKVKKVDDA